VRRHRSAPASSAGFAKVSRIVSVSYAQAMESSTLSPFLEGVHMSFLIDRLTKFVASMMSGPAVFTNEHFAYARPGIGETAFEETVKLFHARVSIWPHGWRHSQECASPVRPREISPFNDFCPTNRGECDVKGFQKLFFVGAEVGGRF
jgi:hypothetical protein